MKRVYTHEDRMMVGFVQGVLESHGIHCFMKNENLGGAVGDLPPNEVWPEVWVTHEHEHERAEKIVKDLMVDQTGASDWRCPNCHELIEAEFGQCWNCGTEAPPE